MKGLLAVLLALCLAGPAWAGKPNAAVSQTPPAGDRADAAVTGSLTATGVSSSFLVWGSFNLTIGGASGPNGSWTAAIRLERSFDGGSTWYVRSIDGAGTQAVWNTADKDVSVVFTEPENGMLYRLNVTAYTSGTINYRMSTTSGAAGAWKPW